MKKYKFRVPTWNEGKELMDQFGKSLNLVINQIEENLSIENDKLKISCHNDERGFSYFVIRIIDESLNDSIEDKISKYI